MTKTTAPRVGARRVLRPAGLLDLCDPRVTDHAGHTVQLTQPHGCPRNGTMAKAYVNCLDCSTDAAYPYFVGLVNIASLEKPQTCRPVYGWTVPDTP